MLDSLLIRDGISESIVRWLREKRSAWRLSGNSIQVLRVLLKMCDEKTGHGIYHVATVLHYLGINISDSAIRDNFKKLIEEGAIEVVRKLPKYQIEFSLKDYTYKSAPLLEQLEAEEYAEYLKNVKEGIHG